MDTFVTFIYKYTYSQGSTGYLGYKHSWKFNDTYNKVNDSVILKCCKKYKNLKIVVIY